MSVRFVSMGLVVGIALPLALASPALAQTASAPPAPLAPVPMPFIRAGDPALMAAGPTPQQYQLSQPPGSTTYRFVNPCSVDIRIRTVSGMTDTVSPLTGTRFLARTAETLASSPPLTNPRTVSVMTLGDPGASGCTVELTYGRGG